MSMHLQEELSQVTTHSGKPVAVEGVSMIYLYWQLANLEQVE